MLRCWEPRDAPRLKEAVDSSLDHLRPWMVWADAEPEPLSEKAALLRRFRGRFDLGQDFVYGIFDGAHGDVLGGTGLHPRSGDESYEIGYWIRASHIGRGLATETTAALTRVAFELCGVDRVDIKVEPGNERSLAIPRKLGFVEEATLRRRLPGGEGRPPRDVTIFALFRGDYAGSPAASAAIEAYDALGERVL
ncbi:MAG: GNAT family N-acetyltransferase [Gaiellaceae bacterium]